MQPAVSKGKHDRSSREQAFIDAATAVFAEHGYEAATTREIAERAGSSEGLIHRYFGGKQGLLTAALEQKAQRIAELMETEAPDRHDLHEDMRVLMLSSIEFIWEHRDFMRVACSQGVIDPKVGRVIGDELNAARVAVIRRKLERHQRAGRVRKDVDVHAAGEMIAALSYQAGFFMQVVYATPRDEVRAMVQDITDIVLRGIEAAPDGSEGTTERGGVR